MIGFRGETACRLGRLTPDKLSLAFGLGKKSGGSLADLKSLD